MFEEIAGVGNRLSKSKLGQKPLSLDLMRLSRYNNFSTFHSFPAVPAASREGGEKITTKD
jgi:hypothetical protein